MSGFEKLAPGTVVLDVTDLEKAKLLDSYASLDAMLPEVIALSQGVCGKNTKPVEAAARALRFAQLRVRYAADMNRTAADMAIAGPSTEFDTFLDTPAIVRRGYDDCDGKARVLCALLRARGIETRVRPVMTKIGQFRHVQAESRWQGSQRHPLAQPEGWILLEPTAREAFVGEGPRDVLRRTGRMLVRL